jgi:hypothetical protein
VRRAETEGRASGRHEWPVTRRVGLALGCRWALVGIAPREMGTGASLCGARVVPRAESMRSRGRLF